jgi:hypothetical protein
VEAGIETENFAVARAASDGAVTRGLPGRVLRADFVTPGAGFSGGILVIEAGCRDAENNQNADGEHQESQAGA